MQLTPIEFSSDDRNVIRSENKPFICRPDHSGSDTSVLLVHGFTGTPWEMAPLARHLAAMGMTSVAVRLPGHGTTPEDLAQRHFEEWVDTVSKGQHFLKNEGDRQVAVGLSTGAMVTIAAHLKQNFDGLALLSPYLKVKNRLAPLAGLIRYFIHFQKRELAPDQIHHYYERRPIEGVYQLNRLIRSVRGHLSDITVPTLVACAEGDNTIDPVSAIDLYRRLGSQAKELHQFGAEVPHVLTTSENPRQEEILTLVGRFIESISHQQE